MESDYWGRAELGLSFTESDPNLTLPTANCRKIYSTLMSAASANARFAEQTNETLAFARRQHVRHRNLRELQTKTLGPDSPTFRVARTLRKLRAVAPFGATFFDKQPRTQRCPSVYLDDAESFESALGLGLCAMLDCGVLNLARSIIEPGSNSLPQVRVGLGEVPKNMHEHGLNRQVFG